MKHVFSFKKRFLIYLFPPIASPCQTLSSKAQSHFSHFFFFHHSTCNFSLISEYCFSIIPCFFHFPRYHISLQPYFVRGIIFVEQKEYAVTRQCPVIPKYGLLGSFGRYVISNLPSITTPEFKSLPVVTFLWLTWISMFPCAGNKVMAFGQLCQI